MVRLKSAGLVIAASIVIASASFAQSPAPVGPDDAFDVLTVAELAASERNGPKGEDWDKRMREDRARFLAALDWLIANKQDEAAVRLAGALGPFWDYEFVEGGRQWLDRVLALPGAQGRTAARARALLNAGVLAFRMGDQAAAGRQIDASLSIARELGDRKAQSQALSALARNALRDEDHDRVRKHAEEAMRIATEIGDRRLAASARHMLAYSAAMQGQLDRAEPLYRENVRVGRELGDKALVTTEIGNLAYLAFDRGNHQEASAGFREYLRMSRESGDDSGVADALMGFGLVEVASGRAEAGARVLGAVQAAYRTLGLTMDPASKKDFDKAVARAKAQAGPERFAAAFAQGESMPLPSAVAAALGPALSQ